MTAGTAFVPESVVAFALTSARPRQVSGLLLLFLLYCKCRRPSHSNMLVTLVMDYSHSSCQNHSLYCLAALGEIAWDGF